MEIETSLQKYRPSNEPYVGARLLEGLPYLFGEKGNFIVGLFAYLRWVDDVVDERVDLSTEQKMVFLRRQMSVIDKRDIENLSPEETIFSELPWDCVPEHAVRQNIRVVLGSVIDDVKHQGFKPRTDREIRHYNWRTIRPVIDGLFLVLNGRHISEDSSMMKLMDAFMRIGSLEGLGDDLGQRVIKLPLKDSTRTDATVDEILEEYNEARFGLEKRRNLKTISSNMGAFMNLDISTWQKVACILYMGEVLIKKGLFLSRKSALSENSV